MSRATVSGDVKAILDEWRGQYRETAGEYLNLQMKRLDVLLNGVWDDARGGREGAIDRALNIIDRQNKLMRVSDVNPVTPQPVQINLIRVPHREKKPDVS